MHWAVLMVMGCSTRTGPAPPQVEERARPNAAARGWALRALVAEARGDVGNAERAWRWVGRLDSSGWAPIHTGWFLWRQGREDEAAEVFSTALSETPWDEEALLGVGSTRDPGLLDPLLSRHPCRVAWVATGQTRVRAEAACIAQ